MKSTRHRTATAALASCASGLFLALVATAAPAGADPTDPTIPLPPAPAQDTSVQSAGPVGTPLPPAAAPPSPDGTPVPAGAPAPDGTIVPQPDGVPHLASPTALPPGSTMDPSVMAGESPNVGYLKDLWHAVQNQEISGKEALLLGVAQRGMNTPYPDQAPGPNVPISPGDPAAAPALPADPALAPPVPAPVVNPVPPTP